MVLSSSDESADLTHGAVERSPVWPIDLDHAEAELQSDETRLLARGRLGIPALFGLILSGR
jgi:hypothetical protein